MTLQKRQVRYHISDLNYHSLHWQAELVPDTESSEEAMDFNIEAGDAAVGTTCISPNKACKQWLTEAQMSTNWM